MDYDPFDLDFRADPYPAYAALRADCPVHHLELPAAEVARTNQNPLVAEPTSEFYSVARYDDVLAGVNNQAEFASGQGPGPERLVAPDGVGMLIYADEPHHSRQRRIVVQAFAPKAIAALRPDLESICRRLVDGFAADGAADLVPAYASQTSIEAMSLILGVCADDRERFKRWTDDTLRAFGGDPEAYERSHQSLVEFQEYFLEVIGRRRADLDRGQAPPPDVLTRLIHPTEGAPGGRPVQGRKSSGGRATSGSAYEDRQFSDPELLMAIQVLLVAGIDTVNHAIGNGAHLLLTHPDARALLAAEPDRWMLAVEEILRFEAPAQALFRNTTTDVEVAGCPIPAGSKVRMLFASANRDPKHFTEPDVFKIDRPSAEVRRHLAFGHGIHACVGAALGRTLLEVALRALLDRLPGLRLDPDRPPARDLDRFHTRSWRSLPVRWDPPR